MPENPSSGAPLEAPLPDHIQLSHEGTDLVLDFRWFRPYHLFMLVFTVFWCGFLVFWYSTALRSPSAPSMMLWFPLIHVAVGIGMAYGTVAGFVNHTRITVGNGAVAVRIGPVPWRGGKRLEAREIKQVFCEEVRTNTRSGQNFSYHVNVITPENQKLRLVSGLAGSDLAIFIEQEIEKALGITDRKVPGELQK